MSRPAIEAFALRAVGEAIRVYADNMRLDPYGNFKQYECDVDAQEKFRELAEHLVETAHDVARVAKISRILDVDK